MRAWLWLAAAIAAATAGGGTGASQPATDGWMMLFNGQNMEGWTKMNDGDWGVESGVLKYRGGGNGWLRTNAQFTDFQAISEWRYPVAEGDHDSGFFFRAGLEGKPWPRQGYQLNMGPGNNLGSVGGIRGARAVPQLFKKPAGEWNSYDLIVVGDAATCIINGEKAWDASGVGRPEGGYLGWQGEGYALEVKSVRLRKLTASQPR
jgi:hypothetical protein